MKGKDPLDPDPIRNLAYNKTGLPSFSTTGKDGPFKKLGPFLVPLHNPAMNPNRVARTKVGEFFLQSFVAYLLDRIHTGVVSYQRGLQMTSGLWNYSS